MSLPKPHEQSFCYRSICFIGLELKLSVMRLYFCLVLPLLRASGKDKTMKRIPKTPIEFDYDLWTTEDGKCMVRVKLTGEVTEVDHEVMKILRREEKQLRRSMQGAPIPGCEETGETATILSLDFVSYDGGEDMSPAWLEDPERIEDRVLADMMERELLATLTPKQIDVYEECLMGGKKLREYAREKGLNVRAVFDAKSSIQKKFQKILDRYSTNE